MPIPLTNNDRLAEHQRRQRAHSEVRRGVLSRLDDLLPARSTPENGDIVVRAEYRNGTLVYVLHTAPREDQYLLRTREEGVAQALAFAKRQFVRAWLTDEGYDFTLLEDFRVVASV
jgi:hypothetical protein